jgi:hypothetical protein
MTTIGPLPPAPTRGDAANFAAQADAFVGHMPTLRNEINAVAGEVNANAAAAAASAINAATAATTAAAAAASSAIAAHNADPAAHPGVWSLQAALIEKVVALAALDVDASLGNFFQKTLSAPSTLTFSNAVAGTSLSLEITNSGGAQTITWPAAVHWPGGTTPTPTAGVDLYVFTYNGTVWRGALSASYAS